MLWTTEFGRMPTQQAGHAGRDHNPDAFTCWMMGAGVKGGVSYGATDDFGRRAAVELATRLRLLRHGAAPARPRSTELTYYHNGVNRRLTDVHGTVLRDVLS